MKVDSVLVDGCATGELLVLDKPVSFWGGVSSETGLIIDPLHPQVGSSVEGRILTMPHAKGSSGTSSALAELLRIGKGPAGIVLGVPDSMMTVGSLVAESLYQASCPIVVATLSDNASGRWRIQGESLEVSPL